jgi:hypothetical protein
MGYSFSEKPQLLILSSWQHLGESAWVWGCVSLRKESFWGWRGTVLKATLPLQTIIIWYVLCLLGVVLGVGMCEGAEMVVFLAAWEHTQWVKHCLLHWYTSSTRHKNFCCIVFLWTLRLHHHRGSRDTFINPYCAGEGTESQRFLWSVQDCSAVVLVTCSFEPLPTDDTGSPGHGEGPTIWPLTQLEATVTHTCNPSYSDDRDQEDCGSKPARANSSVRPYLKKPFTKTGLVEWLKVKTLSLSPSTAK